MNNEKPELVEPAYVSDGDRVYVYAGLTADKTKERWRPAKIVTAAGDHARVAFKDDAGAIVDTWRALRAIRVLETDRNAPNSPAYLETLREVLG